LSHFFFPFELFNRNKKRSQIQYGLLTVAHYGLLRKPIRPAELKTAPGASTWTRWSVKNRERIAPSKYEKKDWIDPLFFLSLKIKKLVGQLECWQLAELSTCKASGFLLLVTFGPDRDVHNFMLWA